MPLKALEHKKRTVADLIRFIGNTAETESGEVVKTPNYSILLGAGASVTSGVRSGQTLVGLIFTVLAAHPDFSVADLHRPA